MGCKKDKSQNTGTERNGLSKPVKTVAPENEINCRQQF